MKNKSFIYLVRFYHQGWGVALLAILPLIQKSYGMTILDIGYISMILTVVSILAALVAYKINAILGTKNVVFLGLLLQILACLGFLLPHSLSVLWIVFIIAGISAGIVEPVLSAHIMKVAKPSERAKEMGNYGAAGDLGRIGITALATILLGMWSIQASFLIQALFAIFLILYLTLYDFGETGDYTPHKNAHVVSYLKILKSPKYLLSLFTGVLDAFSSSSIFIFLPLLLVQKNINIASTGFFTALFFSGYFTGRLVLGRLGDKHGRSGVLIVAEVLMGIMIVSLVFINSYWLIIANIFLLGVFTRGTVPLIKAMVADGLEDNEFEGGYGLYSSVMRTSNALSRPAYSFIGNFFGIGSIFFVSAIVAILTAVPAYMFYRRK